MSIDDVGEKERKKEGVLLRSEYHMQLYRTVVRTAFILPSIGLITRRNFSCV